jgi:hypothetical protein
LKKSGPVIDISIVDAIPSEAIFARVGKEKCRPVEPVLLVEVCDLFGRRRFTEDRCRGLAGHELDQKRDQRHNRPDDQQHQAELAEKISQLVFHSKTRQENSSVTRTEMRIVLYKPWDAN